MQNRIPRGYPTVARFRTGLFMLAALAIAAAVAVLAAMITTVEPRPAAAASGLARYVAQRGPVQSHGQAQEESAAWRPVSVPASGGRQPAASPPYTNPWQLQATLPGAVIKDISFPTSQVGYAAAELGQVWKTTDGGAHWSRILNLGFPYYWYGVQALDASNVVISGFINNAMSGVIRWSQDGGATWSPDIALTTRGWSYRPRFTDATHGLVLDGLNYDGPNAAHYTTSGGHAASDWTPVVPDPAGGWFGNQFSLLPSLKARASGITYCTSLNLGAAWSCRPSVDSVFDGPVFFADDQHGWVGGGSISPAVEGWVHATTDGGTTWSPRTLDNPWPIREIRFVSNQVGWAAGGNIYSQAGGMYFSSDGGQTWSLDANTGAEMDACDSVATEYGPQVWCAGYTSGFNGLVYTLLPGGSTPTATVTVVRTNTTTPTATRTAVSSTNTPTATSTPITTANTATATATSTATAVTPSCVPVWHRTGSPNPGENDNALFAVASISAGDAWAVGMADNRALVEHWNGVDWSVSTVPTVTGRLKGVAAAASNDVWAVGYAVTESLIMHWDGSAWSRVPGPNPGAEVNVLNGVAVVSANDVWAVGYTGTASHPDSFIVHWNGAQWSTVTSPNPDPFTNVLLGVSAISASDVWAVGYKSTAPDVAPLAEHWNGSAWSAVPGPSVGGNTYLYGVAAVSASDVWAVGYLFDDFARTWFTVIMHWDGTRWSQVASPNPGSQVHRTIALYGVSATAANDVWAVGYYQGGTGTGQQYSLIVHWDGMSWRVVPDPAPSVSGNTLFGIDAHRANDLWAVGYRGPTTGNGRLSLVLHAHDVPCGGPSPTPCPLPFGDVQPTDYFYEAVRYLYCRGVISGYASNVFLPYNNTTRGQLAKIVVLAHGWEIYTPPAPTFVDVPSTHAFYQYIETAYNSGIISGYDCGTGCLEFRPGNNVTRGQLCKIVTLAGQWPPYYPTAPTFADVPTTDPFYGFIEDAYHQGIISGYTCGTGCLEFRPGNNATRGQICKIVYLAVSQP